MKKSPPPQTINSLVWLLNCEEKTLTFSFSSQDKQVSQDVLQYLSNRAYGTCCSTHFRVAQRQMETFEWQMAFYLQVWCKTFRLFPSIVNVSQLVQILKCNLIMNYFIVIVIYALKYAHKTLCFNSQSLLSQSPQLTDYKLKQSLLCSEFLRLEVLCFHCFSHPQHVLSSLQIHYWGYSRKQVQLSPSLLFPR